jgi:hypothetical protein
VHVVDATLMAAADRVSGAIAHAMPGGDAPRWSNTLRARPCSRRLKASRRGGGARHWPLPAATFVDEYLTQCRLMLRVLGRLPREGRCHKLERQASEKPQGRKPRARFTRWWSAMGIVALPVVAWCAGAAAFGPGEARAEGDGVARRGTSRRCVCRNDRQEHTPMRR